MPERTEQVRAHRVKKLLAAGLGLLALGLAYAAFIHITGWAIPCLFRQVTGFKCPGCGVTSMCMALLRLDFAAAFAWNPGLMILAPFLGAMLVLLMVQYIRTGSWRPAKWQSVCLWGMLGFLLVWGVVRNVLGI